mmetsp:Transcript_8782/g.12078  ORF Transcript_8782/g.12078 Transcript_8782/m.12078 type:complete len:99 (+) Transcript_8782:735-1031(+)
MIFAIHLRSNFTFFININTEIQILAENLYQIEKSRKFYGKLRFIFVVTGFRQCSFESLDKKIFIIHKYLQECSIVDSYHDNSDNAIGEILKYYFIFKE